MIRVLALLLLVPATAAASASFVSVRDDGTLASLRTRDSSVDEVSQLLVDAWASSGAPLPEVLSVWTTFPFDGSIYPTYALNQANDARGIGFDAIYGGDGTFPSALPPVQMITLHNDVTQLAARRAFSGADGSDADFARYLFLLELSHRWGPAPRIAAPGADDLIGFPFHWSFFVDAGGGPAGGNVWHDNADGTFTAAPRAAAELVYTPLDLYLMGLAGPAEVPPFGVLENVAVPPFATDPMSGGAVSAKTFPVLGGAAVTVSATRRVVTIEEIVAQNGPRLPGASSRAWTFGVMLVIGADYDPQNLGSLSTQFDEIAASLPGTFHEATGGRATLDPVALPEGTPDAGADAGPVEPQAPRGCALGGSDREGSACALFLLALAIVTSRFARRPAG